MTEPFVTAITTSPSEIRVYALYPALGFGAFTRQAVDPRGPRAEAAVFHAACRFRVASRGID